MNDFDLSGLEYEPCPNNEQDSCFDDENNETPSSSSDQGTATSTPKDNDNEFKLSIAFFLMIIVGTILSILNKLVAIPFYNYPNFVNIFGIITYILISVVYIVPVYKFGLFSNAITPEQVAFPKRPFVIMGLLDCTAATLQTFAAVYLPGPLLVLLPQAAIPISMAFSNRMQGETFRILQYIGAIIVLLGIVVVLEPLLSHRHAPDFLCQATNVEEYCTICQIELTKEACLAHQQSQHHEDDPMVSFSNNILGTNHTNDVSICEWVRPADTDDGGNGESLVMFWSIVLILSCVPMSISSIYKEMILKEIDLDAIYLNGWVAFFQLFFSILLAAPGGMVSSPPVEPAELPEHLYDGLLCYLGTGTIDTGCHPDNLCSSHAFLAFNLQLLFAVFYTVLMMYILKYGSANLLFLALTIMVPLGNLAFALPFMPGSTPMHLSDILGLIVIMTGLVLYRRTGSSPQEQNDDDADDEALEQFGSRDFLVTANTSLQEEQERTNHDALQEPLLLAHTVRAEEI